MKVRREGARTRAVAHLENCTGDHPRVPSLTGRSPHKAPGRTESLTYQCCRWAAVLRGDGYNQPPAGCRVPAPKRQGGRGDAQRGEKVGMLYEALPVTTTCSRNACSMSRGNALQPRGNPGIAGNLRLSAQRDRAARSSVGLASVQIMPAHTIRRSTAGALDAQLYSPAFKRRLQSQHLQQTWRPPCPSASEVLTRTRRHRSRLPPTATARHGTRPGHPSKAKGLAVSSLVPAGQALLYDKTDHFAARYAR
ncbi:hypothetical protein L1887_52855 [Cichorium endivia]|nr:hypothetical protein L1887_52855 [Cichorium endivia]